MVLYFLFDGIVSLHFASEIKGLNCLNTLAKPFAVNNNKMSQPSRDRTLANLGLTPAPPNS